MGAKWTELWSYQQQLGMGKMVTHHFWQLYSKSPFLCKKQRTNGWEIEAGPPQTDGRPSTDFPAFSRSSAQNEQHKKPMMAPEKSFDFNSFNH
ncbi:hypothetical protein niasHT_026778 [Heterodera trifolii]|uniref:Uncharacterized protein n=1 Tax=Heterodera trifolii TaxID=157864 RepID=A0ABD2K935_9BILA